MVDVSLRPVVDDDIPIFFEQQFDAEAAAMAAFPSRDRDAHDAHWAKILREGIGVCMTVVADERVAGNVVSWTHDGTREIGYWIGKEFWGAGIATAALRSFLGVIAERPLVAWVAAHNHGSIRVLEKCGFAVTAEQPQPDERGVQYVVMELRAEGEG